MDKKHEIKIEILHQDLKNLIFDKVEEAIDDGYFDEVIDASIAECIKNNQEILLKIIIEYINTNKKVLAEILAEKAQEDLINLIKPLNTKQRQKLYKLLHDKLNIK